MNRKHVTIVTGLTGGIFLGGMALALVDTNHFAAAGLVLSLASSGTTIGIAFRDAIRAREAEIKGIEEYPPISARRIKFPSGVIHTPDRILNIEKQVRELYGRYETLADHLDARVEQMMTMAQLAHERLTLHEEVELPKMISSNAGTVIAGGSMAILGTIAVFAPDQVYAAFSGINDILTGLFNAAAGLMSKIG